MLLDRADGGLARVTGRTTAWGHTFDLVAAGIGAPLLALFMFGCFQRGLGREGGLKQYPEQR